ncbi:MAG: S9 family peptidase [Gemmatimonadota bacterium]|jgi:dipeptidyl aminopeptidase/acylaminoacyl peptidase
MSRCTLRGASLAAAAAALILSVPPTVQAQEGGWTPELAMRYRTVGGVAISSDGSRVAYTVRHAEMEGSTSRYVSQVWVAAADGSGDRQYTRGPSSAASPAFSPDGTQLAFLAARGGDDAETQVWVLPLDGGEAWALTDAPESVGSFAWSPQGDRIAYTMRDTATTEERERKEEKRDEFFMDSLYHYAHLYAVPVNAGDASDRPVTRLTSGHFQVRSFDWSPDGREIVFSHQPDPRINTGQMEADISVVASTGGDVRPLVTRPGVEGDPRFSPDGRTVAFTSEGGQPEPVGLSDVWVVSASGGTPRKLGETPDRSVGMIGWSPDGSAVWVQEAIHTQRGIVVVPADGSAPEVMVPPSGNLGDVAVAHDGSRMAFTWQDPDTPADVYVSPTTELRRTKLSDANADVPRPTMGRTEVVSWKSGPYTIEGLLTYPVGYEEGTEVPLLLNVHGGPAGVFTQSFTGGAGIYMIQVFAQHGYAVLRPNPRGSMGYGKDFRYANVKDWGGGDYRDLMRGVDQVLEMGVTTPDSLVEAGWSYGGYMTSWIVTHTDRFKAASMGAGLPDLIPMSMTTDIQDYLVAHMGGKEPWEDFDTYEKHSPIYSIGDVTTPTQILHGAQDERVPTDQGLEFYRALRRRGVPTQMILYPRTPHGPREPKLLMSVTPHILDWFDQWLGRSRE